MAKNTCNLNYLLRIPIQIECKTKLQQLHLILNVDYNYVILNISLNLFASLFLHLQTKVDKMKSGFKLTGDPRHL